MVEVVHLHKEGALLTAKAAKINLLGMLIAPHGTFMGKRKDICRNDAHDAGMHPLGARRHLRTIEKGDGIAFRTVVLKVLKKLPLLPPSRLLENAHN